MSRESELRGVDQRPAEGARAGGARGRRSAKAPLRPESSFITRVEGEARRWRPTVFLGSSSEALPVAKVLKRGLRGTRRVALWTDGGVFRPSRQILNTLVQRSRRSDFAVLIGGADDLVTKRQKEEHALRDNVVFEFGLFAGALGLGRSLLLVPRRPVVPLPSDLGGMVLIKYETERPARVVQLVHTELTRTERALRRLIVSSARLFVRSREFTASQKIEGILSSIAVVFRRLRVEFEQKGIELTRLVALKKRCLRELAQLERRHRRDVEFLGLQHEVRDLIEVGRDAVWDAPDPAEMNDPVAMVLLAPPRERAARLRKAAGIEIGGVTADPGWGQGVTRCAESVQHVIQSYVAWLGRFQEPLFGAITRLSIGIARAMERKTAEHRRRTELSLGLSLWHQHRFFERGERLDFTMALRPPAIEPSPED